MDLLVITRRELTHIYAESIAGRRWLRTNIYDYDELMSPDRVTIQTENLNDFLQRLDEAGISYEEK